MHADGPHCPASAAAPAGRPAKTPRPPDSPALPPRSGCAPEGSAADPHVPTGSTRARLTGGGVSLWDLYDGKAGDLRDARLVAGRKFIFARGLLCLYDAPPSR